MAYASLQVQTHTDWEWVVVDDGSSDGSADFIASLDDSRVRLIRFAENRGRPHARQAALDAAYGDYLAMLDADDWIYPEKLERQVEVLEAHPELSAVGTGMMIIDGEANPFGVQGAGSRQGVLEQVPFRQLGPPPLAHGPTMMRMGIAREVRYDLALSRGEDSDFLMRALSGRLCALMGAPMYAYRELDAMTYDKIKSGVMGGVRIYKKHWKTYPVRVIRHVSWAYAKMLIYYIAHRVGQLHYLVQRRSQAPSIEEVGAYLAARESITEIAQSITESWVVND